MDTLRDMSLESEQARTSCAKLMLLHDCMMTLHLTSFLTLLWPPRVRSLNLLTTSYAYESPDSVRISPNEWRLWHSRASLTAAKVSRLTRVN